ncbi:MAG TPA: HAD-IA family hydrolase [Candidatus Saccharimonadales bacterium]|nr:HAD-IA family hydrolase [Candidatus Saccharimonadales bacterium]
MQLDDAFGAIVAGGEVKDKPDTEGFLLVLRRLGVAKDRAVEIGDSARDVKAAHSAGIDSVLFYPPAHNVYHAIRLAPH